MAQAELLNVGTVMGYFALGHRLPRMIATPLFGDRAKYGPIPDTSDATWQEWLLRDIDIYNANQRQSAGGVVNRAGYTIMRRIDLGGKRVLEIGPGALDHVAYWHGSRPAHFTCIDVRKSFLELAVQRLRSENIAFDCKLLEPEAYQLPVADQSFDVVLSFYALEHIYPLGRHLDEIKRVLRVGGTFAGAIPCEGGLGWGLGRLATSRRWIDRNTSIDLAKLICWEHPNFADSILNEVSKRFTRKVVEFWPMRVPVIDVNLIAKFVFERT